MNIRKEYKYKPRATKTRSHKNSPGSSPSRKRNRSESPSRQFFRSPTAHKASQGQKKPPQASEEEEPMKVIKKSIWVPVEHVRYIKGPNNNFMKHFERKNVYFTFRNPSENNPAERKFSKSINIVIEGPYYILKTIEKTLLHIVNREMANDQKSANKPEKTNGDKQFEQSEELRNTRFNFASVQNRPDEPPSPHYDAPEHEMHPDYERHPPQYIDNDGPYPPPHIAHARNVYDQPSSAAGPGPHYDAYYHQPFEGYYSPHPGGPPQGPRAAARDGGPPRVRWFQLRPRSPLAPRMVHICGKRDFRDLLDLVRFHEIKRRKSNGRYPILNDASLIFESLMDDALFQYVLKLSAPEEMRLEGLAAALPPQNPLKELLLGVLRPPLPGDGGVPFGDRDGEFGPINGAANNNGAPNNNVGPNNNGAPNNNGGLRFSGQSEGGYQNKGENGPVRSESDEIIDDLGQISDFLNSCGNFEPGDIPGLGGVNDDTNGDKTEKTHSGGKSEKSAEKSRKAAEKSGKRRPELLAYSENAEKALGALPLSEKLGPFTNWVAQSKTFSNFVLNRVRTLSVALIGELALALGGDDPASFEALPAKEIAFFEALCAALGNFGAEGGLELRRAIEAYPRYTRLELNKYLCESGDPRGEEAKQGAKRPKPTFKDSPGGRCRKCRIDSDTFECGWCREVYCRNCLGNLQKPPCKECQRSMSVLEKVSLYQSISFDHGRRRMAESFRDGKSGIEETSFVLSLVDPFSLKRIETPGRGTGCKHRCAFDVGGFLSRLKINPKSSCPICNKALTETDLEVDGFVDRILVTEPEDVREVVVSEDGAWTTRASADGEHGTRRKIVRLEKSDSEGEKKKKKCIDLTF